MRKYEKPIIELVIIDDVITWTSNTSDSDIIPETPDDTTGMGNGMPL